MKTNNKLIDQIILHFNESIEYDWSYCGVIDCNYYSNTDDCRCTDTCRCSIIEDINFSNYSSKNLISILVEKVSNDNLVYCIDRIVRLAKITADDFEAEAVGGYYGQELGKICLSSEKKKFLTESLIQLKDKSDLDKIKFTLTLEYGYLLDDIKKCNSFKVENIDLNEVNFQDDYRKKIDVSENYYDENYNLPRGIFIKPNNRYRLIDGYHRVMKAKSINLKTIKGIVLY